VFSQTIEEVFPDDRPVQRKKRSLAILIIDGIPHSMRFRDPRKILSGKRFQVKQAAIDLDAIVAHGDGLVGKTNNTFENSIWTPRASALARGRRARDEKDALSSCPARHGNLSLHLE
jgi:hypothetical protein